MEKEYNNNLIPDAKFDDVIQYLPLEGESEVANFRCPETFVFIFFEKCNGWWYSVDFVQYEDIENQVLISFPGQIHSWKTGAQAKGHKLILSKKFVEVYMGETRFSSLYINEYPVLNLPEQRAQEIFRELKLIGKEDMVDVLSYDIVKFRMQLVLSIVNSLLCQQAHDDHNQKKRNPTISKFVDTIEHNFKTEKSVAFYANQLAVTSNYLNVLTKHETGLTAKDTINARIVLEAKRMLLGSDLSIKEIAFELGFASLSSFSAFLHNKTGIYPKSFREKYIKPI